MGDKKIIAIDFGGTTIKIALLHNGEVCGSRKIPALSDAGLKPRLDDTESIIRDLTENKFEQIDGIGIAMPGLVDFKSKRVCEIYKKYEDAPEINLEQWCKDKFGLPMIMEQDSKAALLGEVKYGCGQGYKDVLLVTLGTGVGTAVMLDGQILNSRNHFAGALGSHIIIDYSGKGRYCTCGNRGCLEAYAASYAVPGLIRGHRDYLESGLSSEDHLDYNVLKKWYDQADRVAKDVVEQVATALRAGIVSLIHCYDPALIILSGGVVRFGSALTDQIVCGIEDMLWGGRDVKFAVSDKPEQSVLLGLGYLVEMMGDENKPTI